MVPALYDVAQKRIVARRNSLALLLFEENAVH